jgi:hypothetical protein
MLLFKQKIGLENLVGKEITIRNKKGSVQEKGFMYTNGDNDFEFIIPITSEIMNQMDARQSLFSRFKDGDYIGRIVKENTYAKKIDENTFMVHPFPGGTIVYLDSPSSSGFKYVQAFVQKCKSP